ncbi:MAG: hypothetical protein Q8O72_09710 [Bacteroidales bacterium]|jgi:hypothetical protein|nr:hypothetical protein [Bacteroidales bacterium]
MKKFKILIIIALTLGLLGGTYAWFFVYNKPHRDIENATADFTETAENLYNHYVNGLNAEDKNYDGAVIEFIGNPTAVESADSLKVVVFVFNQGMFGDEGIRCTLLPWHNDKTEDLSPDHPITIKGFCAGYNGTDIILEQCSIINH